jgi:small-conductance mechanosensitive channel
MNIAEQAEQGTQKALTSWWDNVKAHFNGGKELAEFNAKVKEITDKLTASETALATANAKIAEQATLITARDTEISDLKASHAKELDEAKKTAGAQQLAKVGVTAVATETETATTGESREAQITAKRAELAKETDSAKRAVIAREIRELRQAK